MRGYKLHILPLGCVEISTNLLYRRQAKQCRRRLVVSWKRGEELLVRGCGISKFSLLKVNVAEPQHSLGCDFLAGVIPNDCLEGIGISGHGQARGGSFLLLCTLPLPVENRQSYRQDGDEATNNLPAVLLPKYVGLKLLQ